MCSGKQKRAAILARRRERREQAIVAARVPPVSVPPWTRGSVLVDKWLLAPSNSYGEPAFVRRGYYVDVHFICSDCGSREVWAAAQQKWWYEVAKGYVYSTAARCLACRRQRRSGRMNNNQCNAIKAS